MELPKDQDSLKFPFDQDYLSVFLLSGGSVRHAQRVETLGAEETSVNLTGINNSDPSGTQLRWRTVM